jgi:hypothetical protein
MPSGIIIAISAIALVRAIKFIRDFCLIEPDTFRPLQWIMPPYRHTPDIHQTDAIPPRHRRLKRSYRRV